MPLENQKAIGRAFVVLLAQKNLDKITIEDISIQSGVSKEVFYTYYTGIGELLQELLSNEASHVMEVNDAKSQQEFMETLRSSRAFISNNKKEIYNIYFSSYRKNLIKYLGEICTNVVSLYVNNRLNGTLVSKVKREHLINFYEEALQGMILRWIAKGMQTNHEVRLARLATLLESDIKAAIDETTEDQE